MLGQWELSRGAVAQKFDQARENIRRPFRNAKGRIEHLPGPVQQQLGTLRHQEKAAYQQLERQLRGQVLQIERQRFDPSKLSRKNRFGEPRYLRDFYFDEANTRYIENFCRKFASDDAYREEVLSGRAHWVERNALFVRNLRGHCAGSHSKQPYLACARAFFKWICAHAVEIIELPDYQPLQATDNQFIAQKDQIDPEVREAVELLNRLGGIQTKFSCQGVSGTVLFQGESLLVVSQHEERAYVSFESLADDQREQITRVLPGFPAIELLGPPGRPWQLRSLGNNLDFRRELLALAQTLLETKTSQG